jgi:hypothetical protein
MRVNDLPIPTFSLREIVEAAHEQFRDIANAFSRALCRLSMIFTIAVGALG